MSFNRANRLAEELKKEISQIFREEIKDPRIGFASITRVEVSSDLRYARVLVSILGSPEEQKKGITALKKAGGFIRSELARRIRLRYMPELNFHLDASIEHGVRIANLIKEQLKETDEAAGTTTGGRLDGEA